MKAHRALEMVDRMESANLLDSAMAERIVDGLVTSQKFELCLDDLPSMSNNEMKMFAMGANLPFHLTYFDIPGVGGLLARDYADAFLIQPFFDVDSVRGMAPPELQLALVKDDFGIMCGSGDQYWKDEWAKSEDSSLVKLTSYMVKVVIVTLAVLRCNNVEAVDNAPPVALNKKRVKNGKIPFFTYKTLHIHPSHRKALIPNHLGAQKCGPRLHMRRGHIRRLQSGVMTWVQSCVVGSPKQGMVFKDYRVTA